MFTERITSIRFAVVGGAALVAVVAMAEVGGTRAQRGGPAAGPTIPARLNKLVPMLQAGSPVFGNIIPAGVVSAAKQAANSGWDFVCFDMMYSGPELEESLQFLLDRRQIVGQGTLAPTLVPMARISGNGALPNAWLTKHSLDQGVYGIMFPKVSTVDQAMNALVFSRYAQAVGVPDFQPEGHRGVAPGNAQRWWGIPDYKEYHRRADIWPLDASGELMDWIVIEDEEGIKNLPAILRQVKISAVIADEENLALNRGMPGESAAPDVQADLQKILQVGKQFKVPVGTWATAKNIERRVQDGFQILLTGDAAAIAAGRKAAPARTRSAH